MNNIDILFINLPTNNWYKEKLARSNSMPPLGLLYVATYAQKQGYKVKVIDFAVESLSENEFICVLANEAPRIVGLSTYNETWNAQKIMCGIIKRVLPTTKIFAGGAFATFCYEDVLIQSETDFVVRGEGEVVTLELCNYILGKKTIDLSKLKGLCYKRDNGTIQDNGIAERIKNLDALGIVPDRSLVDLSKYIMPFTISTSRGCPGECIFCSSKAFWGKKVYMRSSKSIFDEVIYLHDNFNALIFYITDDTFTASYNRVIDFCQMIKKSGIKFVWGCESRADILNENLVKTMTDAGCKKLQIGLESADNEILSKIKKKVTIEEIENGISLAHKNGLHVTASYIIGHAFDTHETINKTINFAMKLQNEYGAHVVGSVNTPFPGTEQYEKRNELEITVYEEDWNQYILSNPIISTRNISRDELRAYHRKITDVMSGNRKS